MQLMPPRVPLPVRTGPWIRKRDNQCEFDRVSEPLTSLYNTEHDAWKVIDDNLVFQPDDVWMAAAAEYNRRYDLYMQKKPF